MVEKQRSSGSGAQDESNGAFALGSQEEIDEDDFVKITGAC